MSSDARHLHWGAGDLWARIEPLLPGLGVEVLARAESTNTMLVDRVRRPVGRRDEGGGDASAPGRRQADLGPCLLVAEHQTRGRGRMGRDWVASPGASLTFSLSLPLAPADWSGLSLAVGVALADALDPLTPGQVPRLGLKWPNDLWLLDAGGTGGRKLGGVLIETVPAGGQRVCVVGVGLNVRPQRGVPSDTGVASLDEIDPQVTAPATLARVALPLVHALRRFESGGFAAFVDAYAARDLLCGRSVTTTSPDCPLGQATGVDAGGALCVRDPQGRDHRLVSGEISVRPGAPKASGPAV